MPRRHAHLLPGLGRYGNKLDDDRAADVYRLLDDSALTASRRLTDTTRQRVNGRHHRVTDASFQSPDQQLRVPAWNPRKPRTHRNIVRAEACTPHVTPHCVAKKPGCAEPPPTARDRVQRLACRIDVDEMSMSGLRDEAVEGLRYSGAADGDHYAVAASEAGDLSGAG
ncbi:hypothetical protein C8Q80DRAFT_1271576 [Daedaleopsis nitida]|nr:hypothetical protein C8Q80DRAFT_1271576 [Daedaleopsis nitida]